VAANKLMTPDTSAQDEQIKKQKEQQQISLDRQRQNEQQQAALVDNQAGLMSRTPRGRRLLQASTGDTGVSTTLGG
jgi:hypothetical protein